MSLYLFRNDETKSMPAPKMLNEGMATNVLKSDKMENSVTLPNSLKRSKIYPRTGLHDENGGTDIKKLKSNIISDEVSLAGSTDSIDSHDDESRFYEITPYEPAMNLPRINGEPTFWVKKSLFEEMLDEENTEKIANLIENAIYGDNAAGFQRLNYDHSFQKIFGHLVASSNGINAAFKFKHHSLEHKFVSKYMIHYNKGKFLVINLIRRITFENQPIFVKIEKLLRDALFILADYPELLCAKMIYVIAENRISDSIHKFLIANEKNSINKFLQEQHEEK